MEITFHLDPALVETLFRIAMSYFMWYLWKRCRKHKQGKRKTSSGTRSFSEK